MSIPPNQIIPYGRMDEKMDEEDIDITNLTRNQNQTNSRQTYPMNMNFTNPMMIPMMNPMNGGSMNGIPTNMVIPQEYLQNQPLIIPNNSNQRQVVSSNDMQKNVEYFKKMREKSIENRDRQLILLKKEELDKLTKLDAIKKEEDEKEEENFNKLIENYNKGSLEYLKIYKELIGKEETEIKDSENKEGNGEEKKKPKKDLLQNVIESQKIYAKGISKLKKKHDKRKKERQLTYIEQKKEVTQHYLIERQNSTMNNQNDYISTLSQVTLMGVAKVNEDLNNGIDMIGTALGSLNNNAKGIANFLDKEYKDTKEDNKRLQDINQGLKEDIRQKESDNQMLNQTINIKENEITHLQTQNIGLQSNITDLQQQNEYNQQKINEQQDQIAKLKSVIDSNENKINEILNDRTKTEDANEAFTAALYQATKGMSKVFLDYLKENFKDINHIPRFNVYNLVNDFYNYNISKYTNIKKDGNKVSIFDIKSSYKEEDFEQFIKENLIQTFFLYMEAFSDFDLSKHPNNENAKMIKEQSSKGINENNLSKNIIKEVKDLLKKHFPNQTPYSQPFYPQPVQSQFYSWYSPQNTQINPFTQPGGFNNTPNNGISFQYTQPQYQQPQYPQTQTNPFMNYPQQHQQEQQPTVSATAVPTGNSGNLMNTIKPNERQDYSHQQTEQLTDEQKRQSDIRNFTLKEIEKIVKMNKLDKSVKLTINPDEVVRKYYTFRNIEYVSDERYLTDIEYVKKTIPKKK